MQISKFTAELHDEAITSAAKFLPDWMFGKAQIYILNNYTVLSLKTAPGAYGIEKVTLLFDPLKSAPSYSIFMAFLSFPFLSSIVNTGFPYSKQKHA